MYPRDPSTASTTTADVDERAPLRRDAQDLGRGPRLSAPERHVGEIRPRSSASSWLLWARSFASAGIGAQPFWVDEATSLRFARTSARPSSGAGASIVDPGNPPLYYSLLHGWLRVRRQRGDASSPVRVVRCAHDPRSSTRSVGRSATIASASSPRCCSRSRRSRSGTHKRRAGIRLLTLGATSAIWGSPTSFATRTDRVHVRGPAGRWLAYVSERRSRSSRTTRPCSCRSPQTC